MRVTELVGRTDELAALWHAADDARVGAGSAVLLEGEAGIGKTRLIDEVAAHADRLGMQVYRGVCEQLEQGRAFGPILEALGAPDGVPPVATDGDTGGDRRFLVQDAFVDRVDRLAQRRPTLLAVDDLQWGDRASLSTLWAIARRSADLGVLLVLAYRPAPEPPELGRLVDGCTGLGSLRFELGPIPDEAIRELAADVTGAPPAPELLDRLEATGGNPFVVIELASALSSDPAPAPVDTDGAARSEPPDPLRASLLRRLTALSSETRELLQTAAVLGSTARVEDIAEMQGTGLTEAARAVEEATRAGLLQPGGVGVAFRHDLVRQALYEDLPESVRADRHREAARLLEAWAEPTVVAQHLILGATRGDSETISALRRAATGLVGATPDIAAALLERALTLCHDPATRADVAVDRAEALLGAGRAEEAERQADEAIATPAPEARPRAQFFRAVALGYQGRFGEARAGFEQALSTGALDEHTTALALGYLAKQLVFTLALDEALQTSQLAEAAGRQHAETEAVVNALLARCTAHPSDRSLPPPSTPGVRRWQWPKPIQTFRVTTRRSVWRSWPPITRTRPARLPRTDFAAPPSAATC